MNVIGAIRAARAASGFTEREIGDALGMTSQAVHNKLAEGNCDMRAGTAARILDVMGYRLAVVPVGRKLPDGAMAIDEWSLHGNSPK